MKVRRRDVPMHRPPSTQNQELKDAFTRSNSDSYDQAPGSELRVQHHSSGGGCGGSPSSVFTVNDGDQQVTQHDFKDKHRYHSGLSIGPDGRQILAQKSTDTGYARTEIPLATKSLLGTPLNYIRRPGRRKRQEGLTLD